MPEFPPTELPRETAKAIQETYTIAKSTILQFAPVTQTVQVTADDQEVTVIDTSQMAMINNKPHTLSGWIDMSNFAALAQTAPNAEVEVRWYVDGKLYRRGVFTPDDFSTEPLLLFLERMAVRYHKVTIITRNTGASDTNPLNFDYSFEIKAALQPWSQLV